MGQRRVTGAGNMDELHLLPYDEYVAQLPRKRMSAGILLRDEHGRVLLVEPSYKPYWEIPGGVVEAGEAPWATAVRELHEEIGLTSAPGKLVVIDYVPPENDSLPERIAFVFDGGHINEEQVAGLMFGPEVVSAKLCTREEIHALATPLLANRLGAAIDAVTAGVTSLCEGGKRVA